MWIYLTNNSTTYILYIYIYTYIQFIYVFVVHDKTYKQIWTNYFQQAFMDSMLDVTHFHEKQRVLSASAVTTKITTAFNFAGGCFVN